MNAGEEIAQAAQRTTQEFKCAAVLSCPRVGWNEHWGCVQEALAPWHIPIRMAHGAYWHQSMQNLLEDCVNDGLDLVLALDYDSVFKKWHFWQLLQTLAKAPYADAMAALQVRRGSIEAPLMSIGEGVTHVEINGNPVKARSAHFGFTLIRTEALKKMPKPWFWSTPGKDGTYRDDRIDADINFWVKWAETGNSVYIDPMCNVGHIQLMVSEFVSNGDQVVPVHTYVHDWRQREAPPIPDDDSVVFQSREVA